MTTGRLLFAGLAVLVFAADRVTKALVNANVAYGTERELVPHLLWLTNTLNAGAAFGIAQSGTLLFLLGSIVVTIGLVWYVARNEVGLYAGAMLGLILGGTMGNGYDRLVHGNVTDFLAVHWWPVFNVADSAISIGVVLLLLGYLVRSRRAG